MAIFRIRDEGDGTWRIICEQQFDRRGPKYLTQTFAKREELGEKAAELATGAQERRIAMRNR